MSGVCVSLADESHTIRNVADDGWLNFDRLGLNGVNVSICENGENVPLRHRRVLRPTVACMPGRELD